MVIKTRIVWTLKELSEVLRARQLNKFDCNLGVSGKRGDGKSTFLFKVFNSFKKDGFRPQKHQVYAQKHILNLLTKQKFGFCWDDEAINSGYKRDFQHVGQKKLVKVVTNYRDNYNIYASALPFFYSLDKDLRELIFVHVHIVERGMGVILLPLRDQIHTSDPWDTKNNIKIETKEYIRMKSNPNARFRYNKLTTFAGYIYFGDMTQKQREIYERIKSEKRAENFKDSEGEKEKSFIDTIYSLLVEGKLSSDGLMQTCLASGRKYSVILIQLNRMLKDNGETKTARDFYRTDAIRGIKSTKVSSVVPLVR